MAYIELTSNRRSTKKFADKFFLSTINEDKKEGTKRNQFIVGNNILAASNFVIGDRVKVFFDAEASKFLIRKTKRDERGYKISRYSEEACAICVPKNSDDGVPEIESRIELINIMKGDGKLTCVIPSQVEAETSEAA